MEAIVMAAGEGLRLRPVTQGWPKPILPIDGRPVVATVLRELRAAGCDRVTVVTGYLAEQVERLLGDGSGFGLELRYVPQPRPDGSADAVSRGLAAGAETPLLVATADTVFQPGDLARFTAAFAEAGTPGAAAIRRDPPPGPQRAGVEVEDGVVKKIVAAGETPFAHASLWGLGTELTPYLADLGGPPFELAEAYQRAIEEGLRVSAFEVGPTRDLTDPLDLVEENFLYLSRSE
jgi:UDP-N-acetylglucosamine diphosphorylase / glucose-1-phosphate thymidylyltransferase / UDP-N-acetylgalactosamine diphosphorylase / glucosamine-1-phosphate N-acetyltransferase / galactosamine-1-phosphate N-acetyltransferase